ncbi:MAG TPA: SAM-dependent methyltransferase [Pseudonocardiaceae bacterium]|nr:SAM-dependent methyltransferase [Pseudonocardiaceae bacterium]
MSTTDQDPLLPPGVDLEHPSVARVYDYYLGGKANWAIDREFGKRVLSRFPLLRPIAKANRQFLHRSVRYLVRQGIRQFVDVGSGVPTMGPTHEVADELAPDTRVVYIDNEPVAVAHAEMLLDQQGDPDRHAAINADLRFPDAMWRQIAGTGVIDLDQPVAMLFIAVLHVHQTGADGEDVGARSLARFRELMVPGSSLAISHITSEGVPPRLEQNLAELKQMYDTSSSSNAIWRNHAEIRELFGDFEIAEPGLTWTPDWHPEETSAHAPVISFGSANESVILAGVGRKP